MGERERLPEGCPGDERALCLIRGTILQQPVAVWCQATRQKIARFIVAAGETRVPVVALDLLADEAATLRSGQPVRITGRLVQHEWTTGDGAKHTSLEVETDLLHACEPKNQFPA